MTRSDSGDVYRDEGDHPPSLKLSTTPFAVARALAEQAATSDKPAEECSVRIAYLESRPEGGGIKQAVVLAPPQVAGGWRGAAKPY